MIKAVIFDMNGVITDTEPIHELAMQEVLKKRGFTLTTEDYTRFCPGRNDEDGLRDILKHNNLTNLDLVELVKEKVQLYSKLAKNVHEVEGALNLIKELSKKVKLGVATSALRDDAEIELEQLKIRQFFHAIVSSDDVSMGKPDPEPYLLAATKLSESPENCLVIEDAKAGIAAAKAAGMKCIALKSKYTSDEDLLQADKIVISLAEIKVSDLNSI